MNTEEIIKALRDMAKYPTVTLPRDSEALKAAADLLAQPEQEPVAFINIEQRKLEWAKYMSWDTPTVVTLPKIPLYTTPPQRTWVGLTEQDRIEIYDKLGLMDVAWLDLMEAIETKLKEKNT